jgi:hypothetical protein
VGWLMDSSRSVDFSSSSIRVSKSAGPGTGVASAAAWSCPLIQREHSVISFFDCVAVWLSYAMQITKFFRLYIWSIPLDLDYSDGIVSTSSVMKTELRVLLPVPSPESAFAKLARESCTARMNPQD